jgi:DNA-binding XRE family transcriptional regulator
MEYVPVRCRIPELLLRIGKDQKWLADETGKSQQKISDYCNMRDVMNLRTAALIAFVLRCRIDDLYVWEWRTK